MARGRMLNKSISASVKFNNLSDDTCRLLATWIISHLDMRGVFYGDPAMVKSIIFPRRVDVTVERVANYLQELCESGLVKLFESNGDIWQYWPTFAANQVGLRADRESSDFPPPPDYKGDDARQHSGNIPANSQQDDGKALHEVEGESEDEIEGEDEDIGANAPQTLPETPKTPVEPSRKAKPPPLTPGAQEFLRLFSAKRFSNAAQRDAILELERLYPENFCACAKWAAEKGVARGQAISMMRTALPTWGQKNKIKRGGDGRPPPDEPAGFAGLREVAEKHGIEIDGLTR